MIYNITCNTDNNYAQHCCATLCSLFENNKDMIFNVHVLTNALSIENEGEIKQLCSRYNAFLTIHEVDESRLEGVKFRKHRPLTKAAYYRILLPEIIDKSIDKILYLDCDMIVVGSVRELFEIELDSFALAATKDCMPFNSHHRKQLQFESDERSFCSGIMMINLKYWREHNSTEALLEYSRRERGEIFLHDQDALNYVFKKQWFLLPPKWNKPAQSYMPDVNDTAYFDVYEYVHEPIIIHFSSDAKPWFNIKFPYSKLYRKFLAQSKYSTPVFIKIPLRERVSFEIMNIKYFIRKYIMPFIPNIVLLIIKDIIKIFTSIFSVFNRNRFRYYLVKEGINAIK